MSRWENLKNRVRRKVDELRGTTRYKIMRYWNGICPLCDEHIGIDIRMIPAGGGLTAKCPVCGEEIYELIK